MTTHVAQKQRVPEEGALMPNQVMGLTARGIAQVPRPSPNPSSTPKKDPLTVIVGPFTRDPSDTRVVPDRIEFFTTQLAAALKDKQTTDFLQKNSLRVNILRYSHGAVSVNLIDTKSGKGLPKYQKALSYLVIEVQDNAGNDLAKAFIDDVRKGYPTTGKPAAPAKK